jgi:hypothetical protein
VDIVSPDKVEKRFIRLDLKEHTMTTATMALAELAYWCSWRRPIWARQPGTS